MSSFDDIGLAMIPSGYKEDKLYSVLPNPTFGSELAINGDFTTDSDWTKGGGWSIVNGEAVHTGSGNYIEQGSLVQGTKYRVVIVVTQASGSGFPQIYMGGLTTSMTSPNTYTFDITAQSGDKIKLRGLNDCKVDSISVKEVLVADGDFDFSRSSSATRVNSQGLIETVQILSSEEEVTNGDFSQIGSEQITNGDFSNGENNWSFGTGWSIIDGKATVVNQTGWLTTTGTPILANKQIKLQFDVVLDNGTLRVKNNTNDFDETFNTVGSYTITRYYSTGGSASNLQFPNYGSGFSGSIDNVSVKEVGQGFTFGDGWGMGDGIATCDGTQSSNSTLETTVGISGITNKQVKFSFDITNYQAGTLSATLQGTGGNEFAGLNSNGTYTAYISSADNTPKIIFTADTSFVGSIDNISVKEVFENDIPRLDYSGGVSCPALLLEPQSTNTISSSNTVNAMNYVSNITKIDNATISPDSTFNAMIFTPTETQGVHRSGYNITAGLYTQGDIVTFSGFIKANGYDFVTMGGFFGGEKAVFNVSNGTIVSQESNVINTKIVKLANDWYRLSTTYTFQNSIGNGYLYAGIYVMNTENGYAFTGDGVSGVYGYGFQAEQKPFATSYIPTNGTSVTRNADVCNNAGTSATFNDSEGVLYAEISALADDGTNRAIGLSDGTGNNRVGFLFRSSNTIRVMVVSNGSVSFDEQFQVTSILDYHKVAVKYKANDFALWIDGVERQTDTSGSTPIGLNELIFTIGNATSQPFYGNTKQLIYFNEALSDEELEALTTL